MTSNSNHHFLISHGYFGWFWRPVFHSIAVRQWMVLEQPGAEGAGSWVGISLSLRVASGPLHVASPLWATWASSQHGSLGRSAGFMKSKTESSYFVIWLPESLRVTPTVLCHSRQSQKPSPPPRFTAALCSSASPFTDADAR